jgi:hypothetical protein
VAKVGEGERELDQHLATAKSSSILRLCHRRYHHGYALAEGMERGVVGDKGWWGIRGVGLYKAGGTDKGLFVSPTLSVTFWGWVKKVGWRVSKPNRAASYTARLRSGQEAGVGAGPESHGRGVDGFVGVRVRRDIV